MNTIRTLSVNTTIGNPTVDFMLNIPFEVEMIRLVDCRSFSYFGYNYYITIPTVSFIPNEPLCIANTGGNCNPIEFHFKTAKAINGLHTLSLTFPNINPVETNPVSYISIIFEFWTSTVGIPLQVKQTQWQNNLVAVSTETNSFILDIPFPVDEIIVEDMFFQNWNSSAGGNQTFYTDFLPPEPVYQRKDLNLNVSRTGGATIGMCNWGTLTVRPNKIRYRFAQPLTIRGNYRIWFESDPKPWGAGVYSSSKWGNAYFLFKFISYR